MAAKMKMLHRKIYDKSLWLGCIYVTIFLLFILLCPPQPHRQSRENDSFITQIAWKLLQKKKTTNPKLNKMCLHINLVWGILLNGFSCINSINLLFIINDVSRFFFVIWQWCDSIRIYWKSPYVYKYCTCVFDVLSVDVHHLQQQQQKTAE